MRDVRLRELRPGDRAPIEAILKATGLFYDEEIAVAMELIETSLARPEQTDYIFLCAEVNGALAGYACYGPIPMTDRSYDLYWIAVDTGLHRKGVGRALVQGMEDDLRARGARKIFLDTSGREAYLPTRRFYEGIGYAVAARLVAFYRAGDDKVVYAKEIQP